MVEFLNRILGCSARNNNFDFTIIDVFRRVTVFSALLGYNGWVLLAIRALCE